MQFIDVDGSRVAYVEQGNGQPVVLLHSSTGSKGQWRTAFADWTQRHRVIAPDLLGYGDTDSWHRPRALTVADEVEIVAAVIARADRPVHLVGHSYGGAVALHTALALGHGVASLCLIEPTPFYLLAQAGDSEPPPEEELAEIIGVARDVGDLVSIGFPMAAAHRFVDYWCGDGAWSRLPSERKWQTTSRMSKVHQDFHALLAEKTDIARLATIEVPTLILSGTVSPRPTRRLSRVIAEAIPQSRHRTIAGAGHMMPLTHADAVNTLVLEHMERVDQTIRAAAPVVVPLPARKVIAHEEIRVSVRLSAGFRPATA